MKYLFIVITIIFLSILKLICYFLSLSLFVAPSNVRILRPRAVFGALVRLLYGDVRLLVFAVELLRVYSLGIEFVRAYFANHHPDVRIRLDEVIVSFYRFLYYHFLSPPYSWSSGCAAFQSLCFIMWDAIDAQFVAAIHVSYSESGTTTL